MSTDLADLAAAVRDEVHPRVVRRPARQAVRQARAGRGRRPARDRGRRLRRLRRRRHGPGAQGPRPDGHSGPGVVHPDPVHQGRPGDRALRPARRGRAVAVRAAGHPQVADRSGPPTPGFEPWVGAEVEYFLLQPQRRRQPGHRRHRRHRRAALLRRPRRHPDVRPPHRDLDGDEPARLVATTPTTTRTATASSSRTSSSPTP